MTTRRPSWVKTAPFAVAHLVPLLAFVTGVTVRALVLCVVLYAVRMFFITAGYHRYFAHRGYRLGRVAQFVMAFGGTTAAQKGPLWWAGNHRDHHRYSDTDRDPHSPLGGFWWSHVGWILSEDSKATRTDNIKDFSRFPELRWLNRHDWVGPWAVGVASYLIAGWSGLVVGFFWSTVLLWHGTFFVNSLAHVVGRRRYATPDTSRNSVWIALITGGEGWHNNHHFYSASARQGFFWWEFDPVYYVLRLLSAVGIAHDLRTPSRSLVRTARIKDGHFDIGMFRAYRARAARALVRTRTKAARMVARARPHPIAEIDAHRLELEAKLAAEQEAFDALLSSTLESAEALARLSRRRERERVGVA